MMQYNDDSVSDEEGYQQPSYAQSSEGYDSNRDLSDIDSQELEVALYSQIHYESNPRDTDGTGQLNLVVPPPLDGDNDDYENVRPGGSNVVLDTRKELEINLDKEEQYLSNLQKKAAEKLSKLRQKATKQDSLKQPKTQNMSKAKRKPVENEVKNNAVGNASSGSSASQTMGQYISVEEDNGCVKEDYDKQPIDTIQTKKHSAMPLAKLLTALGNMAALGKSSSASYKVSGNQAKSKGKDVLLKSISKNVSTKNSSVPIAKETNTTSKSQTRVFRFSDSGQPEVIEIFDDEPSIISIKDSTLGDETSIVTINDSGSEEILSSDGSDSDDALITPLEMASTSTQQHGPRLDDITLNLLKTDCDMDEMEALQAVHDSLGECDWTLYNADRFGTGNEMKSSSYSRYYGKVNVKCRNCNEKGHLSQDCAQPKKVATCILCSEKGHLSRSCPEALCYNCNRPGHSSKDCEQPRRSRHVDCYRCGTTGHMGKECPEFWRQYHVTTNEGMIVEDNQRENKRRFCYNCAKKGHFGFVCSASTMDRYTEVLSPFIHSYDSGSKKSKHKRQRKAPDETGKDLGEPPVKRQKTAGTSEKSSNFKSKIQNKIGNIANKFLNTFVSTKLDSTQAEPSKKKKKRNKKVKNQVSNMSHVTPKGKQQSRSQKKFEHKTRGDFPRSSEGDYSKKKNLKKIKKMDKNLTKVSKHLNNPGSSPWEENKGWQIGRSNIKGKRGQKKPSVGLEDRRTVFISQRGFKVTTTMNN